MDGKWTRLIRFKFDKLTGMGPLVGLEVGALGVHLVAAGDVASVNLAPLQRVAAFVVHREAAAVPSDAGVHSPADPYSARERRTLVKHPEISNERSLETRNKIVQLWFLPLPFCNAPRSPQRR